LISFGGERTTAEARRLSAARGGAP
jgi:hypothetical protein